MVGQKILFVEKEVGRCFCCEDCIQEYFKPTIQYMEEEWKKLHCLYPEDFSDESQASLAHCRYLTLEDPDEVWLHKTEMGEKHLTFISHFQKKEERFSYVVVCLSLDGEPSFIFLSFATLEEEIINAFRKGQDLKIHKESIHENLIPKTEGPEHEQDENATNWNANPTQYLENTNRGMQEATPYQPEDLPENAQATDWGANPTGSATPELFLEMRKTIDIPTQDFYLYEGFIEPTVDDPDEIWNFSDNETNQWFIFIATHYLEAPFSMVVICKNEMSEGVQSFELVYAFPTIDPNFVQHFRKGINSLNKTFGVGWTTGLAA